MSASNCASTSVVLVAEARVVRGTRIVDERIALDLAGAQLGGPRLEDREVVEVVAAEDHVHPAPRGVLPDPSPGRGRGRARAGAGGRSPERASMVAAGIVVHGARRRSL